MCPDRELLSAYADGEVPSPWKERIAEHLAACEACRAVVAGYASLGARLRAEVCPGEAGIVERGRARLDTVLQAQATRSASTRLEPALATSPRRGYAADVWGRRVSLPLPLAAAAALAIFLLAGLAAAGLLRSGRNQSPALASAEVVPNGAHEVSMDGILRYLNNQNAQVTLTINLPSEATFSEQGTPVIVRAPKVYRGAATVSTPPEATPQETTSAIPAGTEKGGKP